jgi:hypothetical protein
MKFKEACVILPLHIDDDIIMNNKVQSQSNEPTVTKDSTTNGPFVNILIFS